MAGRAAGSSGETACATTGRGSGAAIDPSVTPVGYHHEPDGSVAVEVHQQVSDRAGKPLFDGMVRHVYRFRDGLVVAMDIEKA